MTWLRWPLWRGLGRGLSSLGLAYIFIVVLMTASAQQRVLANLDTLRSDYSSALARVEKAEERDAQLTGLQASERKLIDEQLGRREALTIARAAEQESWNAFAPLAARLAVAARCGPSPDVDHMSIWNHIQQCQRDGSLDARSEAQLALAVAAQPSAPDTYREVRRQLVAMQTVEGRLDQVRVDITTLEADLAETEALQQAFGEMKTLRESWLLGRGVMTALPPTIMQIVMAFFAGGFGALLITLVLAVYPHSALSFTTGDNYYARILLGALISVCVYIILSGGTAILGDSRPFDSGRMNVMTFCALGLMAGMFSDRVALWLSERASLFFSRADVAVAAERPTALPSARVADRRR